MRPNRRAIVLIAAGVAVMAVGALVYYLTRPHYVVTAVQVSDEPKLDGKADDAVWGRAESTTIPVKNGPSVTLKAVVSGDKIFFMATWEDKTHDFIHEPFTFDGVKWGRGRSADLVALFFDIDRSITDFDKKGFDVMNYGINPKQGIPPGGYIWNFGIKGPMNLRRKWSGADQRGDIWLMGSAYTAQFGKGDEAAFGVPPSYLSSPKTINPLIGIQWSNPERTGMLTLNMDSWREAIKSSAGEPVKDLTNKPVLPYLMYANESDNLENTPYPFKEQMVEITDYGRFKKGDKLPFLIFDSIDPGSWGGSRSEIDGTMKWKNGSWTAELGRKLNTGYKEQIVLPEKQPSYFSVLVRADGKRTTRYSVPATLEFPAREENK